MGIDLTLLPVEAELSPGEGFAHTVLSLDRDYDLWDRIEALGPRERPGFKLRTWFGERIEYGPREGETTYGTIDCDPYGNPVTYARSRELAGAMTVGPLSARNAAAAAYLRTIDDRWVGLYWN